MSGSRTSSIQSQSLKSIHDEEQHLKGMPTPEQPQTHDVGNPQIAGTSDSASDTDSGYVSQKSNKRWWNSGYTAPPIKINYELPATVASVRDGWTWTCQSGAVVSGLLAAVAAQMLTLFKTPPLGPNGGQTVLIISCYMAILFNISATISSFILIDRLGEIGFRSSSRHPKYEDSGTVGQVKRTQEGLMIDYNASTMWKPMLWYWLFTFFVGITSLIVAIMTYVIMQESLAVKVSLGIMTFINSFFVVFFMIWNGIKD